MALSTEALTVLFVLLPGFICAKLIRWLCPRPQQTEMEKVVDAPPLQLYCLRYFRSDLWYSCKNQSQAMLAVFWRRFLSSWLRWFHSSSRTILPGDL